ncbi:hypothetical protein C9374_002308 [Naegleria lovaniensis]|uniref:WD40 repeat-containing protein SMU1 n=1 Tax=Naegleria lovaniensis TaxID=51637 RepID=A0AA88GUU7_NAELO|nr:uncharacterized protein C9374_002308 [Naegleria lovaniensis]KAG2386564.1 hypothetical protein C9374_002308 [Naegleria lovaniensis]
MNTTSHFATTNHSFSAPSLVSVNFNNPNIKKELLLMIAGYLNCEGYNTSAITLLEECQAKQKREAQKHSLIEQICSDMRDGNWSSVDNALQDSFNSSTIGVSTNSTISKSTLYAIYKQYYFELIEGGEYQKAFSILNKRLKPLKSVSTKEEFSDLCLLLTCKSVNEVDRFQEWKGNISNNSILTYGGYTSRDALIEKILYEYKREESLSILFEGDTHQISSVVPQNRLLELLHQAVNYQAIESANYMETRSHISERFRGSRGPNAVSSLLFDYETLIIPNSLYNTFKGHKENVKCVEFIGKQGLYLASCSSDHTIKIWNTLAHPNVITLNSSNEKPEDSTSPVAKSENHSSILESTSYENEPLIVSLEGHSNRVWDLSCSSSGNLLASASSDGTVKIWDVKNIIENNGQNRVVNNCSHSIEFNTTGVKSDLYSVEFDPNGKYIATGGYDNVVILYDLEKNAVVKRFEGHRSSVCSVVFNPFGNLLITGGKDKSIKFWDITSGECIASIDKHLGEVTGLQVSKTGDKLLSCSKDNLNRLWDVRKLESNSTNQQSLVQQKFKGHQNAYKNFIRCKFGPKERVVMSGSEDGYVYIWDSLTGQLVQKLGSSNKFSSLNGVFNGTVFDVAYNAHQGLIASASEDNLVRLFNYKGMVH